MQKENFPLPLEPGAVHAAALPLSLRRRPVHADAGSRWRTRSRCATSSPCCSPARWSAASPRRSRATWSSSDPTAGSSTCRPRSCSSGVPESLALVLQRLRRRQTGIAHLRSLSADTLMDLPKVVAALHLPASDDQLHVGLARAATGCCTGCPSGSPRRSSSAWCERFGSLPEILSASAAELESVEGIGAATARHVRDGLARLVEASIFERYE